MAASGFVNSNSQTIPNAGGVAVYRGPPFVTVTIN
jgi:hypothetical protein